MISRVDLKVFPVVRLYMPELLHKATQPRQQIKHPQRYLTSCFYNDSAGLCLTKFTVHRISRTD